MGFTCLSCDSPLQPEYRNCPACGDQVSDFVRESRKSLIAGNYHLIRKLGGGGMGEVYEAHHIYLQTNCVIKVMRPALLGDPGLGERFLREARVACRIHHPNVATLHEFSGMPDGSFYMVWEFIDGTHLGQLIRERGAMPAREVIALSTQVLHGLEAIHRSGFIHRDISPDNIMIRRDDRGADSVKIIDLGIAKERTETGETQTATGMFIGKAKYASPEQLGMLGPGQRLDARSDLYSFAIVMYEMLAGRAPFVASSPHQYLVMHTKEPPPPLPSLALSEELGPDLQRVIFRALEKDRARRFDSAGAFARALSALMESREVREEIRPAARVMPPPTPPLPATEIVPPRAPTELPRFLTQAVHTAPRRRVVPFVAAAAVLLVVVFVAAVLLVAYYLRDDQPMPVNAPVVDSAAIAPAPAPGGIAQASTETQDGAADDSGPLRVGGDVKAPAAGGIAQASTETQDEAADDSGPLRVGGDVKAPVILSRVDPEYPEVARKARISGFVILEAIITKDGQVRDITVLKPLPFGLDQAAVDAVKQWRFRPGTLEGEPVDVIFNLTVNFKLADPGLPATETE